MLDPTQPEGDSDSVRSGGRRGRPRKAQSLTEKKESNRDCTADESVTGKISISHDCFSIKVIFLQSPNEELPLKMMMLVTVICWTLLSLKVTLTLCVQGAGVVDLARLNL